MLDPSWPTLLASDRMLATLASDRMLAASTTMCSMQDLDFRQLGLEFFDRSFADRRIRQYQVLEVEE